MLTNKDYCDYELRLGLRDIGYPMSTCQINDGPIQMPKITLYEAQKQLREEKFLLIVVDMLSNGEYIFSIVDILNYSEEKNGTANSYEEALSEGIREAVKILKNGIGE